MRRLVRVAALCLWLWGIPAVTAGQDFSEDPELFSTSHETNDLAVGDLDGDGNLDVACANLLDAYFYLNATRPPRFDDPRLLSGDEARAVAVGDLDGDGDLDLALAHPSAITVHRNDTDAFATATTLPGGDGLDLALGDLDADGDLDLVVMTGRSGQNAVYRNDGGLAFVPVLLPPTGWVSRSAALGDLDGDGDLDIVCGVDGRPSCIYRNDTGAWSKHDLGGALAIHSVALGDLDGDGDLDLLCGVQAGSTETSALVFRNDGGSPPGLVLTQGLGRVGYHVKGVALGDVDGDGDLDAALGADTRAGGGTACNLIVLNDGGTFSATQPLESSPEETKVVALADVDGDGDLDLVCGNHGGRNTVYLNRRPPFATQPSWVDGPEDTRAVALADLNGDGLLDLVTGNHGTSVLRLHQGATLFSVPAALSTPDSTNAVAVGDVDGDGDDDLVLGNGDLNLPGRSTLLLNQGGSFGPAAWLPAPQITTALALGSLTGDPRPDLVCGNGNGLFPERNTIYRNDGGTFPDAATWTSPDSLVTRDVALADVDGDGDDDLVAGAKDGVALYRNKGGALACPEPSLPDHEIQGIALGDVDGDGDPDLLAVALPGTGAWCENVGGTFALNGTTVGAEGLSCALADVDQDGDLDALFGALGVSLHLNEGGSFSAARIATDTRRNLSLACGDVDDDGDLDLVVGRGQGDIGDPPSGSGLTGPAVYTGLAAPPFAGDPTAPRNHLANNASFLRSVRDSLVGSLDNATDIRFTAVDAESDPIHVRAEYQFAGEPVWRLVETSDPLRALATSPTGTPHAFTWNLSRLADDDYGRDVILRLRVVSVPRRVSLIQHAPAYVKNLGPVTPLRPILSASAEALDFPGPTTVGDTSPVTLLVTNDGTADLDITSIDLLPEMEIDPPAPLTVPPGTSRSLTFRIVPREITTVLGNVVIHSNDPFQPDRVLPVRADVRALSIASTRLLFPAEQVPLNLPVSILVTPGPGVRVEQGFLHYRSGPSGAFTDSVALVPLEGSFIASVPAGAVVETGLGYYASVENSGLRSVDPPGAPGTFHFQAVEQPSGLVTVAEPNAEGSAHLQGTDIRVQVIVPTGAVFQDGTLFYREGGSTTYEAVAIDPGDPLAEEQRDREPRAIIPGAVAGSRGVEYWVEVRTQTVTITEPRDNPSADPLGIPVTLLDVQEPGTHPALSYRLFSVPLEVQGTIVDVLLDDLGSPDNSRWRLFAYEAGAPYLEAPQDFLHFETGRAYWIIARDPHRLDTGPARGLTTPTTSPFTIPLPQGSSLIGNPFHFHVAWDSAWVVSGADTVRLSDPEADAIIAGPVAYTGSGYDTTLVQDPFLTLEPFTGYWVKNETGDSISLLLPPREAPVPDAARVPAAADAAPGWAIRVRASCASGLGSTVTLGIHPDASETWDRRDRFQPPPPPGPGVHLSVPHAAWSGHAGPYAVDARGPWIRSASDGVPPGGQAWVLDVAKNFTEQAAGDLVVLDFTPIAALPEDLELWLLDRHLERRVDLRAEPRIRFFLGHEEPVSEDRARFVVLAGELGYANTWMEGLSGAPSRSLLHAGYPNPFHAETRIRFDLAAGGNASVRVYDARGALVVGLIDGEMDPGRYEVFWNGKDARGGRVATGIYFVTLAQQGFRQSRKLLLIP